MKFGEALECQRRLKWRVYYINYASLKKEIKKVVSGESEDNRAFMHELKAQLEKVTCFYDTTEQRLAEEAQKPEVRENSEAVDQLRNEAQQLKQYVALNWEGLRKVAKKYDKKVGRSKAMQDDLLQSLQDYNIAHASERLDEFLSSITSTEEITTPLLVHSQIQMQRSPSDLFIKHQWRRTNSPTGVRPVVISDMSPSTTRRSLRQTCAWRPDAQVVVPFVLASTCLTLSKLAIGEHRGLHWDSYFTIFVTLESLFLLVRQSPPDVVLVIATLLLRIVGILNDQEAWGGFSNNVVLSVAVLGIVSAGVQNTGVIDYIFMNILGKPRSFAVALLRLLVPAMILNVGISNTCVMGILIPVVEKWSKEINMHQAVFLMPLSYMLLISGTFAIFSTSSNLITQGLLQDLAQSSPHDDIRLFSTFELAPLTVICSAGATGYLAVMVPFLLRSFLAPAQPASLRKDSTTHLGVEVSGVGREMKRFIATVQVTGASLNDVTLAESGILQLLDCGLRGLVRVERMGQKVTPVQLGVVLKHYDLLYIWSTSDGITKLTKHPSVSLVALDAGIIKSAGADNHELVEVVLDGLCPLINSELATTKVASKNYSGSIVAVRPHAIQKKNVTMEDVEQCIYNLRHGLHGQGDILRVGDNLILEVDPSFVENFKDSVHFASVRRLVKDDDDDDDAASFAGKSQSDAETQRDMLVSGLILVAMIALVASNEMALLQASLLAVVALVFTGCLPQENAFRAIKIRTILTIVGAFGIGKAMGNTNVAGVLATFLCQVLEPFGNTGVLSAIFATTVALGVVFHATAVVILMFPICHRMSAEADVPLHQALAMLMIGAGCQMLSPVSYQTNLMVYASGDYSFSDFPKVGCGVVLVIGVLAVGLVDQFID